MTGFHSKTYSPIQQSSNFATNQNLYPRPTKSFFSRAKNNFQSSGFKTGQYFFLCYVIFNCRLLGVLKCSEKWSLVLEKLLFISRIQVSQDMNSNLPKLTQWQHNRVTCFKLSYPCLCELYNLLWETIKRIQRLNNIYFCKIIQY